MNKQAYLLCVALFLTGCTNENTPLEQNIPAEEIIKTTSITIKLLEFNTTLPVSNKKVIISSLDDTTYIEAFSNAAGHVTFNDLAIGSKVEIYVGTGLTQKKFITIIEENMEAIEFESHTLQSKIAVPIVLQEPTLPTGCEITSLTAILNYYGENVTKEEMVEQHLNKAPLRYENGKVYGPNPQEAFPGDPSDPKGVYIFPEGIIDTITSYTETSGTAFNPLNLTGSTMQEIETMVQQGLPVLTWITRDLREPIIYGGWWMDGTNEYHHLIQNEHAVVLTDITDETVTIMDPLQGNVTHDKTTFFKSFESIGSMAITLY